ncbi:sigma 54-interacting transcriptional regulator [Acinetobacter faecalis]|uniref:sigma-54 interaction domain-containing protein n=1 Tax=Acinetobacter faecalis TaxID=2665161 RepID=UPI002A91888C|nr:sigma 54-interacting transcriptional regulator [Acinetobacter faecalis]MDY6536928.1 sigma 54-interacting transcriptional regulator [Acinetobacter faecalis]
MSMDEVISFMKSTKDGFSLQSQDGRSIFDIEPLRSIIDAIQDGIYITDENAITIAVNSAYQRITGLNRNILIGRYMGDLVELGYLSNSASLEVLKRKEVVTLVQTINGTQKILVTGSPVFDEKNKLICIVTSVRDITELLRAKHAQEQLENLFQSKSQYKISCSSSDLIISRETKKLFDLATNVAKYNSKVLLRGETGTGKSKLARYIHSISPRAEHAFLELNCSGIPDNLLEIELFGYAPGAFTGASAKGKKGLLEIAHLGTLFLDEIGDLPLSMQVKLLKVIEENRFLPVGGTEFREVDIRIISATHRNLEEMVTRGEFREDLFYRINVVDLELPPLKARPSEILPLVQQYQKSFNEKYDLNKQFSPEVIESFTQYTWPGNIRQLVNVIERLMVSTMQAEVTAYDLPEFIRNTTGVQKQSLNLKDKVLAYEQALILDALEIYGSTRATAEALGVEQSTLVKKIARFKQQ